MTSSLSPAGSRCSLIWFRAIFSARTSLCSTRPHGQALLSLAARRARRPACAATAAIREVEQGGSESDDEDWDALEEEEEEEEMVHGPPALLLAGFYLEELAGVRVMLDRAGGQGITLIPSTPTLLRTPLDQALSTPEPRWEEAMPPDWVHGGGWGTQRMALFSGLGLQAQAMIVQLLAVSQMGEIVPVVATPENAGRVVGEVLAEAFEAYRRTPADAGPGGGRQFVEGLPPMERVIPREALQEMGLGEEAAGEAAAAEAFGTAKPKTLEQLLEELGGGWELEGEGEGLGEAGEARHEVSRNGAASEALQAGAADPARSSSPTVIEQVASQPAQQPPPQPPQQQQQQKQQQQPPAQAEAQPPQLQSEPQASGAPSRSPAPTAVKMVEADAVLRPKDLLSKYTPAEVAAAVSWARVAAEVMAVTPWVAPQPGRGEQLSGEQPEGESAVGAAAGPAFLRRDMAAEAGGAEEGEGLEELGLIDRLASGQGPATGQQTSPEPAPVSIAAAPSPEQQQKLQPPPDASWPWQQQQQPEVAAPKPAPAVTPDQLLASLSRQPPSTGSLRERMPRSNLPAGLRAGGAGRPSSRGSQQGPGVAASSGGSGGQAVGRESGAAASWVGPAPATARLGGPVEDRAASDEGALPAAGDAMPAAYSEGLSSDLGDELDSSMGSFVGDDDGESVGLGSSTPEVGGGSEATRSEEDLRAFTRQRTSGLGTSASKGTIPGARTMSKAELKEVASKHGLSYEQLLEDARARGIELPD